jgi:hypothetical protein
MAIDKKTFGAAVGATKKYRLFLKMSGLVG